MKVHLRDRYTIAQFIFLFKYGMIFGIREWKARLYGAIEKRFIYCGALYQSMAITNISEGIQDKHSP